MVAKYIAFAWIVFALSPFHESQAANVPIVDFNANDLVLWTCCYETQGWTFSVTSPIPINAIGWYDIGQDGLEDEHSIGLWQDGVPDPILLGTVPSGTMAELIGNWRIVPVPTTTLFEGDYVIAGHVPDFNGDHTLLGYEGTFTSHEHINSAFSRPAVRAFGFGRPSEFLTIEGAFFGPTLFTVPEPTTVQLACIVLVCFGLMRQLRRTSGCSGAA